MFQNLFFATLTLASLVLGAVDINSIPRVDTAKVVPNAYIVQLSGGTLGKRSNPHEEFYSHLRARGTQWSLRQQFSSDIFTGAAIKVQSESDLIGVAQGDNVVAIYQIYVHDAPRTLSPIVPSGPSDPIVPPDTVASHQMTGIDRLQTKYKGSGIRIAVIDSGIDYTHPALGGGFGPGFKISKGYDFVGDAYTGTNAPVPDSDPFDNCYGHGTAVAGIVGANYDSTYGFVGVAPEASLLAYRIFGCAGSAAEDVIVQAMVRAYNDGADVINLSLSSASGWSSSVMSVVASRISAAGKVVVAAAGNNGAYGAWYAPSPSSGTGVISVASSDNLSYKLRGMTVSNGYGPIPYLPSAVSITTTTPLPYKVPADEYGCSIPAGTSYSGYIAVVRRGNCAFADKVAAIQNAGGQAAIFINNIPNVEAVATGSLPAVLILTADGDYLIAHKNDGLTLSFPPNLTVMANNTATGGLVSSTSTWGPTYDLFFKPNIMAPGAYVFTTWPVSKGSWITDSGTSLAAPLVAGATALLLQAKGNKKYLPILNKFDIGPQNMFQSTALAVKTSLDPNSPVHSLAQQGTGLLQAYSAVNYKTIVTPSILNLNDTTYGQYTHKIYLAQSTGGSQRYTISHVPSATILTINVKEPYATPPITSSYASVRFSSTSITVPGNLASIISPTFVTVTFTPPANLNPTYAVYSGQIKFKCEACDETLVVSYMGVLGGMKNMKVIDNTNYYFGGSNVLPLIYKATGGVQAPGTSWNYTWQNNNFPYVYYRLLAGTQVLNLDLVTADTTLPAGVKTKRDASPGMSLNPPPSSIHDDGAKTSRRRRAHRHKRAFASINPLDSTKANVDHTIKETRDRTELTHVEESASPIERRGGGLRRWFFQWLNQNTTPSGPGSPWPNGTFQAFPIVGELREFWFQSRNTNDVPAGNGYDAVGISTPKFANGTVIPNGSYRILMRALRITGNPSENTDYEHWLSPIINVSVP